MGNRFRGPTQIAGYAFKISKFLVNLEKIKQVIKNKTTFEY